MNGRERLMTIIRGGVPDRPAVKLWGLEPGQEMLHPDYRKVYDVGMELTDLFLSARTPFNIYAGRHAEESITRERVSTDDPEWDNRTTTYHTSDGDMTEVYRVSNLRKPGYEKEFPLKDPSDIDRLLSLPYDPCDFSPDVFYSKTEAVGEQGIVMFGLDHAMYALQRLIGSENFALWHLDHPDMLLDAMQIFAKRIRDHVQVIFDSEIFNAGIFNDDIKPVFGWVGPELCIPPLMSPKSFDTYVAAIDKPLHDLIHQRGGYVWIHCHGKMKVMLNRFADLDVDVLNPIEPPPMGDVTLAEAFDIVGERIALEGNIETHDIMSESTDRLIEIIAQSVKEGKGRRFILCPSSAYMEWPEPTEMMVNNWITYVREGVRLAKEL